MLFQFAMGFVLTARDFFSVFAVFRPHYPTLQKFLFYCVQTLFVLRFVDVSGVSNLVPRFSLLPVGIFIVCTSINLITVNS